MLLSLDLGRTTLSIADRNVTKGSGFSALSSGPCNSTEKSRSAVSRVWRGRTWKHGASSTRLPECTFCTYGPYIRFHRCCSTHRDNGAESQPTSKQSTPFYEPCDLTGRLRPFLGPVHIVLDIQGPPRHLRPGGVRKMHGLCILYQPVTPAKDFLYPLVFITGTRLVISESSKLSAVRLGIVIGRIVTCPGKQKPSDQVKPGLGGLHTYVMNSQLRHVPPIDAYWL